MLSAVAMKGVGVAAVKIRKQPHPRAAQSRTVPSMLALTNNMAAEHSGTPRCIANTGSLLGPAPAVRRCAQHLNEMRIE